MRKTQHVHRTLGEQSSMKKTEDIRQKAICLSQVWERGEMNGLGRKGRRHVLGRD